MRKVISFVLSLLLLASGSFSASISDYSVVYVIQSDLTVRESIHLIFSEPLNESGPFHLLLGDVSNLVVISDERIISSSVSRQDQSYLVSFNLSEGSQEVIVTFSTDDLVFSSDTTFNFFTIFDAGPSTDNFEAVVWLPQGYSILRDLISPKESEKLTDGTKIGLKWNFDNIDQSIPISVRFERPVDESGISSIFIGIPLILVIILLIYFGINNRKKTEVAFFKGFSQDEIKVIEFLQEKETIKQSIVEKEFGFSRAKVTRIMKKLEEHHLITKEQLGRTNRVEWVGK